MMNQTCDEGQCLLRRALLGNALFSTLSGLTILFAHSWVLRILGLSDKVTLIVLGISLLAFAGTLLINARRKTVKVSDAWVAVMMDLAWVVGSYVLLFTVPFSIDGKWLVGVVAELVLAFAVLQWIGIRRIRKSEQYG
jgi:hypothetical protein